MPAYGIRLTKWVSILLKWIEPSFRLSMTRNWIDSLPEWGAKANISLLVDRGN